MNQVLRADATFSTFPVRNSFGKGGKKIGEILYHVPRADAMQGTKNHKKSGIFAVAEKRVFKISGMRCTACSGNVEKRLKKLDGVVAVEVSFSTSLCTLDADKKTVPDTLVIETIAKLGFTAERFSETSDAESGGESKAYKREKTALVICVVCAAAVMLFSMTHLVPHTAGIVLQILFSLPVVICGRKFFTRGIPALFHGAADMDTLIACGSGSAVIYSCFLLAKGDTSHLYFDSCVMIITLVTTGKFLEERIRLRTIDAVKSLAKLIPESVTLIENGRAKVIPAKEMKKDDIIRVTAGYNIPADGIVEEGSGWVDESMFSGETLAVEKYPGNQVTGGTICTSGTLNIKVEKTGQNTLLADIIKMVRQAQGTKAPISRIADKTAGVFAFFVLTVSMVTLAAHLLAGADFRTALNFSLAVMVVSCPCALGLATPVALVSGIGRGARSGILIKSAAALEKACKIKYAVFDKTGTLSDRNLHLEKIVALQGFDENTLLSHLAAAETGISHPLAGAALEEAEKRGIIVPDKINCITHYPGRGISCIIDGTKWLFGSTRLLAENNIDTSQLPDAGKYSTIAIAADDRCAGAALFSGRLKKNAALTIGKLHEMKIKCFILSGDRQETVSAVAKELNTDGFYAGLLPQDKLQYINSLKESGITAMTGDGVNDAPSLAAADIGIAIGNGSVPAHDAADMVITGDDILSVCKAVTLSKRVMRVIRQNLFWAFFYNLLAIPLASGAFHALFGGPVLSPAVCAGAMAASSLTVVLNAARLKGIKL